MVWIYSVIICYRCNPELDHEVATAGPAWMGESPQNIEGLRPLTPTGCLVDSDPDLLIKSKPSSPTVEEVERPQTPGKGIVAQLENEDSDETSEILTLSPAPSDFVLAPPDLPVTPHPLYHKRPKTPGREERSQWTEYPCGRTPATPGREMTVSQSGTAMGPSLSGPPSIPPISCNPYITAPKTPGRDIILPRRAIIHRRKTQMVTTALPLLCDSLRGSPITVSSQCSLSESSSDSSEESGVWIGSDVRTKPLQGLENMPGLLHEEKGLLRQKLCRTLKRRWRTHYRERSLKRIDGSLSSHRCSRRCRLLCEERKILHSFWKRGLDEEDLRLLRCAFERLQEQDNGAGWLSDTLWIPHPHILFDRDLCKI